MSIHTLQIVIKWFLIRLSIGLVIIYCIYSSFFQVKNEGGFLGADKIGRQVLIQNLDRVARPDIEVDSEFFDDPFLIRLIKGEPMRTTIRFNVLRGDERYFAGDNRVLENAVRERLLASTAEKFVQQFDSYLLQQNFEVSAADLQRFMKRENVTTLEELLAGFGFKKYELYVRGEPKVSIAIRGTRNILHMDD